MRETMRDVASAVDLERALASVSGHLGDLAVILIGGADATETKRTSELRGFFERLARFCQRTATAVVDGGTDSGVMRLIGAARADIHGDFPLVGVVPSGAFERTSKQGASIRSAPHHSLILRVPGDWFGDETDWLFAAADYLGGGSAITLVVNGGSLTLREAHQRLAAGHRVITVAGSGRTADALAADEALRKSGRLRVMHLTADDADLATALRA